MNLSPQFVKTIRNVYKKNGGKFLADLPALIEAFSRRWNLTNIRPVPNLSYNFVAYAERGVEPVVLKMGPPNRELVSGMNTLQVYNGGGAVQLLEYDEEKGAFLLERLIPGKTLAGIEDDDRATEIAAELMSRLWRPAPQNEDGKFISLKNWFAGFKRLRDRFDGGTGPLARELVERAEQIAKGFFAEGRPELLLHGDFHHDNILESKRGWLVIDPKGVIGPAEYEMGPLLLNPRERVLNGSRPKVRAERRIAILAERLGIERGRIRQWALAHAVLSAWWSFEDGEDWRYAIRCAELFNTPGV